MSEIAEEDEKRKGKLKEHGGSKKWYMRHTYCRDGKLEFNYAGRKLSPRYVRETILPWLDRKLPRFIQKTGWVSKDNNAFVPCTLNLSRNPKLSEDSTIIRDFLVTLFNHGVSVTRLNFQDTNIGESTMKVITEYVDSVMPQSTPIVEMDMRDNSITNEDLWEFLQVVHHTGNYPGKVAQSLGVKEVETLLIHLENNNVKLLDDPLEIVAKATRLGLSIGMKYIPNEKYTVILPGLLEEDPMTPQARPTEMAVPVPPRIRFQFTKSSPPKPDVMAPCMIKAKAQAVPPRSASELRSALELRRSTSGGFSLQSKGGAANTSLGSTNPPGSLPVFGMDDDDEEERNLAPKPSSKARYGGKPPPPPPSLVAQSQQSTQGSSGATEAPVLSKTWTDVLRGVSRDSTSRRTEDKKRGESSKERGERTRREERRWRRGDGSKDGKERNREGTKGERDTASSSSGHASSSGSGSGSGSGSSSGSSSSRTQEAVSRVGGDEHRKEDQKGDKSSGSRGISLSDKSSSEEEERKKAKEREKRAAKEKEREKQTKEKEKKDKNKDKTKKKQQQQKQQGSQRSSQVPQGRHQQPADADSDATEDEEDSHTVSHVSKSSDNCVVPTPTSFSSSWTDIESGDEEEDGSLLSEEMNDESVEGSLESDDDATQEEADEEDDHDVHHHDATQEEAEPKKKEKDKKMKKKDKKQRRSRPPSSPKKKDVLQKKKDKKDKGREVQKKKDKKPRSTSSSGGSRKDKKDKGKMRRKSGGSKSRSRGRSSGSETVNGESGSEDDHDAASIYSLGTCSRASNDGSESSRSSSSSSEDEGEVVMKRKHRRRTKDVAVREDIEKDAGKKKKNGKGKSASKKKGSKKSNETTPSSSLENKSDPTRRSSQTSEISSRFFEDDIIYDPSLPDDDHVEVAGASDDESKSVDYYATSPRSAGIDAEGGIAQAKKASSIPSLPSPKSVKNIVPFSLYKIPKFKFLEKQNQKNPNALQNPDDAASLESASTVRLGKTNTKKRLAREQSGDVGRKPRERESKKAKNKRREKARKLRLKRRKEGIRWTRRENNPHLRDSSSKPQVESEPVLSPRTALMQSQLRKLRPQPQQNSKEGHKKGRHQHHQQSQAQQSSKEGLKKGRHQHQQAQSQKGHSSHSSSPKLTHRKSGGDRSQKSGSTPSHPSLPTPRAPPPAAKTATPNPSLLPIPKRANRSHHGKAPPLPPGKSGPAAAAETAPHTSDSDENTPAPRAPHTSSEVLARSMRTASAESQRQASAERQARHDSKRKMKKKLSRSASKMSKRRDSARHPPSAAEGANHRNNRVPNHTPPVLEADADAASSGSATHPPSSVRSFSPHGTQQGVPDSLMQPSEMVCSSNRVKAMGCSSHSTSAGGSHKGSSSHAAGAAPVDPRKKSQSSSKKVVDPRLILLHSSAPDGRQEHGNANGAHGHGNGAQESGKKRLLTSSASGASVRSAEGQRKKIRGSSQDKVFSAAAAPSIGEVLPTHRRRTSPSGSDMNPVVTHVRSDHSTRAPVVATPGTGSSSAHGSTGTSAHNPLHRNSSQQPPHDGKKPSSMPRSGVHEQEDVVKPKSVSVVLAKGNMQMYGPRTPGGIGRKPLDPRRVRNPASTLPPRNGNRTGAPASASTNAPGQPGSSSEEAANGTRTTTPHNDKDEKSGSILPGLLMLEQMEEEEEERSKYTRVSKQGAPLANKPISRDARDGGGANVQQSAWLLAHRDAATKARAAYKAVEKAAATKRANLTATNLRNKDPPRDAKRDRRDDRQRSMVSERSNTEMSLRLSESDDAAPLDDYDIPVDEYAGLEDVATSSGGGTPPSGKRQQITSLPTTAAPSEDSSSYVVVSGAPLTSNVSVPCAPAPASKRGRRSVSASPRKRRHLSCASERSNAEVSLQQSEESGKAVTEGEKDANAAQQEPEGEEQLELEEEEYELSLSDDIQVLKATTPSGGHPHEATKANGNGMGLLPSLLQELKVEHLDGEPIPTTHLDSGDHPLRSRSKKTTTPGRRSRSKSINMGEQNNAGTTLLPPGATSPYEEEEELALSLTDEADEVDGVIVGENSNGVPGAHGNHLTPLSSPSGSGDMEPSEEGAGILGTTRSENPREGDLGEVTKRMEAHLKKYGRV